MINLACGLKAKGYDVEMFVYFPKEVFFRPLVDKASIPVHEVKKGRGFSIEVLWRLVRLLRSVRYDAVISFLDAPNIYIELASVAAPKTKIIVSERSSDLATKKRFSVFIRRALHGLADVVVSNSNSHATSLARYPWLAKKVKTIYNGYSLWPSAAGEDAQVPSMSLLAVGRVGPEKNGTRLVEALAIFHRRHGYVPKVSWAGREDRSDSGAIYCRRIHAMLDQHVAVKENWNWLGERSDIPELLEVHRALIHPSLYEGLPNAVCEALIAGRPVLVSNVCDNATLVKHRERGFLFDPLDPSSIADSIERLAELSDLQWHQFSASARNYAVDSLGIDRMVREYEALMADSSVC